MTDNTATKKLATAPTINGSIKLSTVGNWTILHLPRAISEKLPSRGQVMVAGTLNNVPIKTPLEPDGNWGHWVRITDTLQMSLHAKAGDTVTFKLSAIKEWPEPEVPKEWQQALKTHAAANAMWHKITPMARWEWIRWARATNNIETYKKRIEVGCSKMESGERRPCCWNRNLCSEPSVSKNGVLLDPTTATN
jgi:hypothetical protein